MEIHHTDVIVIGQSMKRVKSHLCQPNSQKNGNDSFMIEVGSRFNMSKAVKDDKHGEGTLEFSRTTMVRMLFLRPGGAQYLV